MGNRPRHERSAAVPHGLGNRTCIALLALLPFVPLASPEAAPREIDARHCLDLASNAEIAKCAEQYRRGSSKAAAPAPRAKSPPPAAARRPRPARRERSQGDCHRRAASGATAHAARARGRRAALPRPGRHPGDRALRGKVPLRAHGGPGEARPHRRRGPPRGRRARPHLPRPGAARSTPGCAGAARARSRAPTCASSPCTIATTTTTTTRPTAATGSCCACTATTTSTRSSSKLAGGGTGEAKLQGATHNRPSPT